MTTTPQSTDAANTMPDAAMQMGTEEQANTDVNGIYPMKSYIRPDRYFSAEQIQRLQFLMRRSQEAAQEDGPPDG